MSKVKRALLLLPFIALIAGCGFSWNAPVTVTLKSGEDIYCSRGIGDTDYLYLWCRKTESSPSLKIPWAMIKEFKTHSAQP